MLLNQLLSYIILLLLTVIPILILLIIIILIVIIIILVLHGTLRRPNICTMPLRNIVQLCDCPQKPATQPSSPPRPCHSNRSLLSLCALSKSYIKVAVPNISQLCRDLLNGSSQTINVYVIANDISSMAH